MGTLARGTEIAAELELLGVRAVLDPALASPPCVLIIPPNLSWDQMCSLTASWQLVALAPAANTADRDSWQILDSLVDAVAKAVDSRDAQLIAYTLNGKQYPSYLITFQESV
jgi:hypothetical protein